MGRCTDPLATFVCDSLSDTWVINCTISAKHTANAWVVWHMWYSEEGTGTGAPHSGTSGRLNLGQLAEQVHQRNHSYYVSPMHNTHLKRRTTGQGILTKGHIAGGAHFSQGTMQCDTKKLGAMQSATAARLSCRYWGLNNSFAACYYWRLNDPFCGIHRSRDSQCYASMRGTTDRITPSMGDLHPT